ncbi:hypothetical protein ADEAN_000663600 [Angomonas deanei]|uniref:Uncharacterized protein n=1 Tax=Angomonas deanei TaxID=59799 RepID=A0A7G2CKP9_9TRYP|nr:hypothetical protein ADEAN_000663600 [Angomonas deanei]
MEAKRHINAKQDAGSHRNRGRGFDGELVDNTSGSGVEAAVDATCVNAICQVHNSDVVIVVNKIETVSLTSTETSFPELVDDVSVCRFMLMPDEERLVTVHDTSAKLWNLENGYLLYATDNNLLPSDVSACALLEPLNRQFLLASMTGELKAFSVALGKETIDFSPLLKEANAGGKEILSLNTIAQYRDYNIPYMIVTQADAVYILPVSKEAAVTNVIRLNAIQSVLNESKTTVVSTRLLHCRWLFVSFANATVSLFDITRMTCLLVTFQLPSGGDLEALHVSTFRPPKGETPSRLKKADESNHLLVFGGNSEGMLCIDEAIPNASQEIETDDGMNYTSATKEIFNIIGEWSATLKDSSTWRWIKGKRFLRQGAIPPPTQKDPSSPTRKLLRSKESPTRLNGLLSGVSTATHLYFSPEHLVLFVGTDRGDVKLWDVAGVIKAGGRRAERDRGRMEDASRTVRPTASYPPVLITEWHAHKSGFTAWMGFLHPVTQLPVLMTGGTDRRVFLWSADGVPLGSLSTGRQMDDRSGGKRFGLDPFLPPQEVREEAQWPIFAAYLQQRETKLKVEEPQVARVSAPKDNTVTLSKLDDTVGDAGQTTFFVTETPSRPAQPDQDLLALILSTSGSSSDDSQEDGRGPRLVKSQYSAKITQRKSFANLSRTGATVKEPLPSIENKRAGNFYGFDRKTGLLPNTARATEKKKESENNRSRSTTAARVGEKVKKGKSGKRRTSTSAPPSTSVPRQYQIESLLPRL